MAASSGPDPTSLVGAVERLLGRRVTGYRHTPGGWTVAIRGVLTLDDGRTVFAKLGDVPDTASAIREEIQVYGLLGPRDFLPEVVAVDPSEPVLILEDLSDGRRVPPWSRRALDAFGRLCDELAGTAAPRGLRSIREEVEEDGWERVASDPLRTSPLLPAPWLADTLDALLAAQRTCPLGGDRLVHTDLRSDNLFFRGDRAVAVDWNLARRGDPRWDRHLTAQTMAMEGAGPVEQVLPDAHPGIVSWMAGYLAARAPLPPPQGAPAVRPFQRAQLEVVLPWACRLLDLPAPTLLH